MALSFDDFMKQSAQASPAPVKAQAQATKAAPMGFDDFMKQKAASGHAPDWTDDVKASAKFLGNEIVGVGQALNPMNIASGMYNAVVHPIETGKALINTPGRMVEQFESGDMDGLAQGIGNVAGSVVAGKLMPQAPAGAKFAAQTMSEAVDGTANLAGKAVAGAKSVASNPAVRAAAPVVAKMLAKTAVKGVLGAKAGPLGVIAYDMLEDAVTSRLDAAKAAKAPKPVTTNTAPVTAGQVSSEASTNAFGTKPAPKVEVTASAGKGARTLDGLDEETTQALVDATKNGDLHKLTPTARRELTTAVRNGDNTTVANILDVHTAVKGVSEAVQNKVSVIARYMKDHNIDAESLTEADRQTIADAAYAHGAKNGLPVPKSGRYRGISDDSWEMVKKALRP